MQNDIIRMRSGRGLEVREYGDSTGHPVLFFHGLVGSHHQASYIAEQARQEGLRLVAPNRPGVGRSDFTERESPLDAVDDVEDLARALDLDEFSVIGISGGAPYALAILGRLSHRIKTVTLISGMGPIRLRGALRGMDRRRRVFLEVGSRSAGLATRVFRRARDRFCADPVRFLDRLITTWSLPDQEVFRRRAIYDLFMQDLHQVFTEGTGPKDLAQELAVYRNFGFALQKLPGNKHVTLWQGLDDNIVPPAMAWAMARSLPSCEAHFVRGGHFMAVDVAGQIIARLRQLLEEPADGTSR
jgi:pimeloyl-ACP methyl ester carboxylesterase